MSAGTRSRSKRNLPDAFGLSPSSNSSNSSDESHDQSPMEEESSALKKIRTERAEVIITALPLSSAYTALKILGVLKLSQSIFLRHMRWI